MTSVSTTSPTHASYLMWQNVADVSMWLPQQPAVVPGGVCRHLEGGADQTPSRAARMSLAAASQGRRPQEHSLQERVHRPR